MILCIRISSFFGWFDKWLESLAFDEAVTHELIKFNSMFFYFSILFAPLPGLLVDVFDRLFPSSFGRHIGVCVAMGVSSISASLFSFLSGESHYGANVSAIFFAVLARTFTYGSYAVFVETGKLLFTFWPVIFRMPRYFGQKSNCEIIIEILVKKKNSEMEI